MVFWGHVFHVIPLEVVVKSSDGCLNALGTDKTHSFTLLDAVSTQNTNAPRVCWVVWHTYEHPFFVESKHPLRPIVGSVDRATKRGAYAGIF